MRYLIIFGCFALAIVISIGIYMITHPVEESPEISLFNYCEQNVMKLTCEQLVVCDENCNNAWANTPKIACHSTFTNQIIANCDENCNNAWANTPKIACHSTFTNQIIAKCVSGGKE